LETLRTRLAKIYDIEFDGLTPEDAKARAETLIDEKPNHIDIVHLEYEKYLRSHLGTQRIPNGYRLEMSGRQTPSSNVSRNVDFTGLSPDDARFKRDFEIEIDPKHADSIRREFDTYMAQHQDAEPTRENTASTISERLDEIRNAAEHVHTPQEARRVDTEIHDATRNVVEYFQTHHPEAISQMIQHTTTSPGLANKVARHTSSSGGVLEIGTLIIGGLSLVSSYASVWRFFG
jgi:hypothetical protein